jgi:ribosomal protein S18 acetylase RimI-like enzyme
MPNGILAKDNYVFDVIHNQAPVGVVWLKQDASDWYIFDIDIEESRRGSGLGRKTMLAIEAHVKNLGGSSIGLSVFAFNEIAIKLYESEGYQTIRLAMKKDI